MKPPSEDLRGRIVRAREQGAGVGEVCKRFDVSRSSVERYYRQHQRCGHCRPKKIGGHRVSRLARHARRLKEWIARTPDITLEELQGLCRDKLDVRIGINALWHRLDKLGLGYKKTTRASEQDRPDVRASRKLWRKRQGRLPGRRLVFMDETEMNTKMARLHGLSARPERCVCAVPRGHWQGNSFMAALRMKTMGAPFLIEGAVNGEVFALYVEKVLCPELRPGEIVAMDNVGAHKSKRALGLIKARGARVMYLPAYSPDLNPIEMAFSKLKARLRGRAARNLKDLMSALAEILKTFSARQCRNFFRHAQYASN